MSASNIQQFQLENISGGRMMVLGGGVRNHVELVELVEYKMNSLGLLGESKE